MFTCTNQIRAHASPLGNGVYKDKINTVILQVDIEIDSCLLCDGV